MVCSSRGKLLVRMALLVALGGTAPACTSLVEPYVNAQEKATAFRATPSITNAIIYAETLRENYYEAMGDHSRLNLLVGLALVPLTATAIGLGATGTSSDAVLALGLTGASLLGGHNLLYNKPRQASYAAGAGAINCVLTLYVPLVVASRYVDEIQAAIVQVSDDISAAERILADHPEMHPQLDLLREAVAAAKTARDRANAALGNVERSGEEIVQQVESIRNQVNAAVVQTDPDIAALASNLVGTLNLSAGRITGVAPTVPEQPVEAEPSLTLDLIAEVVELTSRLQQAELRLERFAAQAAERPSKESLEQCGADPLETGGTFAVSRTSIDVAARDAAATANFRITGGRIPYVVRWDGLELPGNVISTDMRTASADVSLHVPKTSATGTFRLSVIEDNGNGEQKLVEIKLNPGQAQTPPPATAGPTSDAAVKGIQDALLAMGFRTVTAADGTTKKLKLDDGIWGPDTATALGLFRAKCEPGLAEDDLTFEKRADVLEMVELVKESGACSA